MSNVPVAEWWIRRMCRWIDLTRRENSYRLSAVFRFSPSRIESRMRELAGRVPGRLSLRRRRKV